MKVRIVSDANVESMSWTVVKLFAALVAFSLVLPPVSRGWAKRYESGLKTVLPARIRAAQINTLSLEFTADAVSVRVKPGAQVEAGQLLAEFDNPELRQMVERAEVRLTRAKERMKPVAKRRSLLLDEQYSGAVMARDAANDSSSARPTANGFSTNAAFPSSIAEMA